MFSIMLEFYCSPLKGIDNEISKFLSRVRGVLGYLIYRGIMYNGTMSLCGVCVCFGRLLVVR